MVQYKVFMGSMDEGNRTNLVVFLDRERGIRWYVSAKCQASLVINRKWCYNF